MNEVQSPSSSPANRRIRFSLGTLLLWLAIIGLFITNMLTQRQVSRLQRELSAQRPLPVDEVARQFVQRTTMGPIRTKVRDVRYSSQKDAYKVDFSWTNATTGKMWSSDVQLSNDGFGTYYGKILNGPFVVPLGYKNGFVVAVESPSPLAN